MTDYSISTHTRRCAASGRELKAGERSFAVLVTEDGALVRKDFAAEAWSGPPPHAVGFWAGHVPPTDPGQTRRIDEQMLLDLFERLEGDSEQVRCRYVIALLLLRRKRLRLENSRSGRGADVMLLRCPRTRRLYEIADPSLSAAEIAHVQKDVARLFDTDPSAL